MDTLTHALSGTLLARATAHDDTDSETLRLRLLAGTVAAAFPDIDFLLRFVDPLMYLNLHRGHTHSLLLLPVWALLLSVLFTRMLSLSLSWRQCLTVMALGLGIHIAGDVITVYGTRLLVPWSDSRFEWPSTFIIDPWFSAIILLGLWLSWRQRNRLPALLALGALVVYVGGQSLAMQRAIAIGDDYIHAHALAAARSHALPQPFSPFNWKILVTTPDTYHVAHVNLLADSAYPVNGRSNWITRIRQHYRPASDLAWQHLPIYGTDAEEAAQARAAWASSTLEDYRRFAVFPLRVEAESDDDCIWFADARFMLPILETPFRYGLCRGAQGSEYLRAY